MGEKSRDDGCYWSRHLYWIQNPYTEWDCRMGELTCEQCFYERPTGCKYYSWFGDLVEAKGD